ncbi:hypothetical protein MASR1M8_15750 [Thermomonas brevis]
MSGSIVSYLGRGDAADRPATPSIAPGALGIYYANDTAELSLWDGAAWVEDLLAGGGASAWGGITGTLSAQSDLQAALDAKAAAKEAVTALTITAGAITLDFAGKSRATFTLALTANVTTVNFANLPGAGFAAEFDLLITQDGTGGRTFAMPASFKALGGSDTAIAAGANAVTVLSAKTFDNGTTWRYAMQESA